LSDDDQERRLQKVETGIIIDIRNILRAYI
jgi:hypothetical protein